MSFKHVEVGDELAYLGFRLFHASRPLRPFVRNYWVLDTPLALPQVRTEHLYPEGGMGMVFNFGDPLVFNQQARGCVAFFDGAHSRPVHLSFSSRVHALGIRFKPGGAFPFFQYPLHAISNATAELKEMGHGEMEAVCEMLAAAPSLSAQLQVVDGWLLKRLLAAGAPVRSELISAAITELKQQPGNMGVGQLCDRFGVGRRRLERAFRQYVGLSPKAVANIYRVERARALICDAPNLSLTEVGYRTGYYDQSHFIHDFKTIVDETPSAYKRRKVGEKTAGG